MSKISTTRKHAGPGGVHLRSGARLPDHVAAPAFTIRSALTVPIFCQQLAHLLVIGDRCSGASQAQNTKYALEWIEA